MARLVDLIRCGSGSEADWPIVSVLRVLTEPSRERDIPHSFGSNAESVMRASYVNESNHLRERAAEMRASSKELRDDNTAAVIMRVADLYERLADRAETRGKPVPSDSKSKIGRPPTRS